MAPRPAQPPIHGSDSAQMSRIRLPAGPVRQRQQEPRAGRLRPLELGPGHAVGGADLHLRSVGHAAGITGLLRVTARTHATPLGMPHGTPACCARPMTRATRPGPGRLSTTETGGQAWGAAMRAGDLGPILLAGALVVI